MSLEGFKRWLMENEYRNTTVSRYIRALNKIEERFNINLSKNVIEIDNIAEFEDVEKKITSVPNYKEINFKYGHRDTSAALSSYKKYLKNIVDKKKIIFNDHENIISEEQWINILQKINDSSLLKVFAMFYNENNSVTCYNLASKYNVDVDIIIKKCIDFSEFIGKTITGNVFSDENNDVLWLNIFNIKEEDVLGININELCLKSELRKALEKVKILNYLPIVTGGETSLSIAEIINNIKNYIAAKGFNYNDGLIENFYLSLKAKPFVILAGTSGTGKTRLVKLFAEAVGATEANGRYKMVAVRPDWSDSSDLFGHVDLNGRFIPGAIIDFIKQAEIDSKNPYFLCLDEMNLARVEYYLSDILSVIETRDFIDRKIVSAPLVSESYYGADQNAAGKYGVVRLPENLYLVGTVNMDETTFPFSRKVLDRANTIEFSYVDLMPVINVDNESYSALNLDNSFLKTEYLLLNECFDSFDDIQLYCAELQSINKILQQANAHIGYRVRDELIFYLVNNKKYGLLAENEAFDNGLMQKILPRIQGSSAAVKSMLSDLFKHCAGDFSGYSEQSDNLSNRMHAVLKESGRSIKYRKSAEKIELMTRRLEEDGFTSYWL